MKRFKIKIIHYADYFKLHAYAVTPTKKKPLQLSADSRKSPESNLLNLILVLRKLEALKSKLVAICGIDMSCKTSIEKYHTIHTQLMNGVIKFLAT